MFPDTSHLVRARVPAELTEVDAQFLPSELQLAVADEIALRNKAIEFMNDPQTHYLHGRDILSMSDRECAEWYIYEKHMFSQVIRMYNERWKRLSKSGDAEVKARAPKQPSTREKVKKEESDAVSKKLKSADKEYQKIFKLCSEAEGLDRQKAISMSKAELKAWFTKSLRG